MGDETTRDPVAEDGSEPTAVEDDPADSIDLDHPERVRIGVTRGETDLEIGPPRDYPDRADVSIRPDGRRLVLSVDAMAGDHGTGHADVELTPAEAHTLRASLEEVVDRLTDEDPTAD